MHEEFIFQQQKKAQNLLERYQKGDRSFEKIDLLGINLKRAELRGINFSGAELLGADLQEAILCESNLNKTNLQGANLRGVNLHRADLRNTILFGSILLEANISEADLRGAILQGAALIRADISGANISDANLEGANLTMTRGEPKSRAGCRINAETYQFSNWTIEQLLEWKHAGAKLVNLENFPLEVQQSLFSSQQGLTLYFKTRLNRLHRFLVEGVIVGILGRDTDCEIERLENREGSAIVRLQAHNKEDLEKVAEALSQRVWEQEEEQDKFNQLTARKNMALISVPALQGLSGLVDQLEKIELKVAQIEKTYQPVPRTVVNILGQVAALALDGGQAKIKGQTKLSQKREKNEVPRNSIKRGKP